MSLPDPRIELIFHETLNRAPVEREAFVSAATDGDEELRREVRRLLAANEEARTYLDSPISAEAEAEMERLQPEKAGHWIGPYKLMEQIGEGGFGTVWVADQERPVRRRVALKIIKMGMDTKEVMARFEQERQALAMMDHPHIAKVFDAGATQWGRPFFVMELVRGITITEYCDRGHLPIAERLALFVQVCNAVQHAHQKGIIHRDLKPSNILVTVVDGQALPKVIDFGVAKATQHQRLTDLTIYTQFQQMIGTPLYMSPEQAEMSALDVDTRTDIYALGVLLYELLIGRTPFDADTLMTASYDEMRRLIREEEAPVPSLALCNTPPEVLSVIARHRQCEPPALIHSVRGDLDWIVMKALEKERARRYDTANGLSMDVLRHLRCEPVVARPPSRTYRFGRLVRRNRLVFAAAGAVAAALIIGLGASMVSLSNERNALTSERKALAGEAEQRKFAEEQRRQAQISANAARESELKAQRFLYAGDMYLVQQALRANNVGRARMLLDRHRPASGGIDLRGWEWRYLWQECRSGAQVMLNKREGSAVYSASFSPDGTQLLVGFSDGQVELWNVAERKLERVVQAPFNQHAYAAFSPRGGSFVATMGPRVIKSVDLRTGVETQLCTVEGLVRDLSFSNDGEWLAMLSRAPDRLKILHAIDGTSIMDYPLPTGGGMLFNNVRISPEKNRMYVSCGAFNKPIVRCVSVPDGRIVWEIPIGTNEDSETPSRSETGFSAMDLSPDGRRLVIATGYLDPKIRVLDAENGVLVKELKGHTRYVLQVLFSDDGRILASTSEDQTVRLWDTATWTRIAGPLRGHNHEVNAIAISDKSHLIASGNKDGEVLLWDTRIQRLANGRRDLPSHIQSAVALPVSRTVLGRTADGKWSLVDLLTLAEQPLPPSQISADGLYPKLFPSKYRRSPKAIDKGLLGLRGRLSAPAISPDGKMMVVASESGEIGFYDAKSLARIDIVRSNLPSVFGATFSPDSQRVVLSTGGDGGVTVWDATIRQELVSLSSKGSLLSSIEFTDDGNTIMVGQKPSARGGEGTCQFWNAPSMRLIERAERIGGRWPQTEAFQPITPAPTLSELKTLMEAEYQDRITAARAASPEELQRLDDTLEDFAELLRQQGRDAEAAPLLGELLERMKQRAPQDDEAILATSRKLLSAILSKLGRERQTFDANTPAILSTRADALVDEVLALLNRQAIANPGDTMQSLKLALLQVWFRKHAEHATLSRRLIEAAERQADNGDTMVRAAAAYCLTPFSNDRPLQGRALQLAQNAANLAQNRWKEAWYQHTLGLVYFRLGDNAEAAKALARADKAAEGLEGDQRRFASPLQTSVKFIRCMVLLADGMKADAEVLFAEGVAAMPPPPDDDRRILESVPALEDLIVWLAYREAKPLLNPGDPDTSAN
jgi:serine/threonine protein kinase/WD40 repeat protein